MIPYGTGISAALEIGKDLGVNEAQAVWIAGSYPYVLFLRNTPSMFPSTMHHNHNLASSLLIYHSD